MQNTLFRKGLVVGVIILFIGLAFIPGFNAVSISKSEYTSPTPIIDVTWETYKLNGTWYVDFNCSFYDNGSGINRVVWYLNGKEMDIIVGPGPVYEFHFTVKLSIAKKSVFKFEAYYGDGLSVFVEIDGSDIKSTNDCDCQSNGKTLLAEKLLNNIVSSLDIKSNDDCACSDGDDYPLLLCAILWYQRAFAMLLFMKTGWDVPMKILNAIGVMYNCPDFV